MYGIDLSGWQKATHYHFQEVLDGGFGFSYIKLTEGPGGRDNAALGLATAARAAGLKVGPYHYFWNLLDPLGQAANFLARYNACGPWDLPPAVDVEEKVNCGTPQQAGANLLVFLGAVEAGCGVRPVIYTGQYYWNKYVAAGAPWAASYKLWVASYPNDFIQKALAWLKAAIGRYRPSMPTAWKDAGWWMWQFGSQVQVPGFGEIDGDLMVEDMPPPAQYPAYRVVNCSWLTIKAGPQFVALPVGFLKGGAYVTVFVILGGWARIDQVAERWVKAAYLQRL